MKATAFVICLSLILMTLTLFAQDCPPAGCNCVWFSGEFDDTVSQTLFGTLQHSNGNHTHYGVANVSCAYTAGNYDPDYGLYHCIGHGTSSIPTHTSNDTGAVNPTFIGRVAAVHYAGGMSESGCTNSGYGDISVPATMVATAGECKIGDDACYTDTTTFPNSSCTTYVLYTTHYGTNGSSLWHSPYTWPLTCPDTWAEAPSPIVIPLHGGGYVDAFTDFDAGDTVTFHLIEDPNSAYPMSWIAKGAPYGFLVLDRNLNGLIDNLREMFGNLTPQPRAPVQSGQSQYPKLEGHKGYTPTGFGALAYFDRTDKGGNGDGVISKADSIWPQLRVWEDTCHCGVSSAGKMYTLDELGITEIGTSFVEEERRDRSGNQLRFKGYLKQGNAHVAIYDVFFRTK